MHRRILLSIVAAIFITFLMLSFALPSKAETANLPQTAGSAYDLVNAVNALRASNGVPPYSINSILMYTAQNQADFMAANGIVTHSGPGGISLTDRLLAAGYPLAGDLSLGGFRAENIISGGEDMPAQAAIDQWTGDAPHLNTMLSPNLSEIGAGVAISGGRVYYVIDAAQPTSGGAPQVLTPVVGGGSAVPANEAQLALILISTPNADGDVIHEVLAGQTLWQIAVSYDARIDEVKHLNNLTDDYIYPGQKLVIKKTAALITETSTGLPTSIATILPGVTDTPMPRVTPLAPTATESIARETPQRSGAVMGAVIGIIAIALIGGGIFTWLGNTNKDVKD